MQASTHARLYIHSLTANMIIMSLSDMNVPNNSTGRHRKNSGELEVFDAAQYFSGGMDHVSNDTVAGSDMMNLQHLTCPNDHSRSITTSQSSKVDQKLVRDKKWKQSSSPGARLASFFPSLFHQTLSKKKPKPKLTTTTLGSSDSKSMDSNTPKDASLCSTQTEVWGGDRFIDGFAEKRWVLNRSRDCYLRTSREVEMDDDDDCGSECSSDLFELKSYDLRGLNDPNELPVYGATDMKVVKKGPHATF